jgi:hypothetical protein
MRIESSVTAISWIPAESIEGPTRLPFDAGLFHYDAPLPARLDDLDRLHHIDAFREANELRAWVQVEDGKVVSHGQTGRGLLGVTRLKFGPKVVRFPAVPLPILRPEPVVSETSITFVQTVGGRMSLPAPRHVVRPPFVQVASSVAWTTLQLTLHADGRAEHRMLGASPFPRHYVYDDSGALVEESGLIDFNTWYRDSFGDHTPWGQSDSPALITAVETAVERELSDYVSRGPFRPEHLRLQPGETLVEQGEIGEDVFLLLDGILAVEVNGEVLAEIGPGAILGERARLEGGRRAATLRAVTPCRVAVVPGDRLTKEDLELVAVGHRREVTG